MPTRHQFTNLPLFIAFSFLGLTRAAIEDPISNLRERVADIDGGQTSAALEGIIANLRDRVGDVDRGQTSAVLEGTPANLRYRVGDADGRQSRAAREGKIANLRDRVGDDGIITTDDERIGLCMNEAVSAGMVCWVAFRNANRC